MTPVELLQRLIRFDTTNPPGNEASCIAFVQDLLQRAGLDAEIHAKEPGRPNLVSRIAGSGSGTPLLLYGHVDVVTTGGQQWSHPPFAGDLADGYVWGRGALDMKGGVSMLVSAFLRAHERGLRPGGDVVLAVLSDEEAGGDLGAKFLATERAQLFDGVRYALGEFGGFSMELGGRRFYAIQVAEKQICWLKATIRGRGGHGALITRDGTMARLARLLADLNRKRLPLHITPVAQQLIEQVAAELPRAQRVALSSLLKPRLAEPALRLLGPPAQMFEPMLRNTVNATIVRASDKINVVPAEVEVELDGRTLPGFGPEQLIGELAGIVGEDVDLELIRHDPGPPQPDLGLFDTLAETLREVDPEGVPVPLLLVGVTDARHFAPLGIQSYGFLPMRLPRGFSFQDFIHGADERVPADAIDFGTDAIYRVLERLA